MFDSNRIGEVSSEGFREVQPFHGKTPGKDHGMDEKTKVRDNCTSKGYLVRDITSGGNNVNV